MNREEQIRMNEVFIKLMFETYEAAQKWLEKQEAKEKDKKKGAEHETD